MKTLFPFSQNKTRSSLLCTSPDYIRRKGKRRKFWSCRFDKRVSYRYLWHSVHLLYICVWTMCSVSGGGHTANRDLLGLLCKTPHDFMHSRLYSSSWWSRSSDEHLDLSLKKYCIFSNLLNLIMCNRDFYWVITH